MLIAVATAANPNLFVGSDGKRYAKFFLINDELNLRKWQVTEASIPRNMQTFKDMPYVVEPNLQHFGAENMDLVQMLDKQEDHRKGNIVEVAYDAKLKEAYAMVEITDDKEWEELTKMTTAIYVSPAIAGFPIHQADGSILYDEWYGAHLARVARPAYGVYKASLKKTCQGKEKECMDRMMATASAKINSSKVAQAGSCQQKSMAADKTAEQELAELKQTVASLTKEKGELEDKLKTASQTAKEYKVLEQQLASLQNEQKEKLAVEIADLKVDSELIQKDKHKEAVASLMKLEAPLLKSLLEEQKVASEKIKELKKASASSGKSADKAISTIRTATADDNGVSKPVKTLADMEGWLP